mgnify:CR=1 FL=1
MLPSPMAVKSTAMAIPVTVWLWMTTLPYDSDSGLLYWLHIVSSNAKAFILGTYHGLAKKYLQSYLDEYSFCFCHRGFGAALLERLTLAVSLSLG